MTLVAFFHATVKHSSWRIWQNNYYRSIKAAHMTHALLSCVIVLRENFKLLFVCTWEPDQSNLSTNLSDCFENWMNWIIKETTEWFVQELGTTFTQQRELRCNICSKNNINLILFLTQTDQKTRQCKESSAQDQFYDVVSIVIIIKKSNQYISKFSFLMVWIDIRPSK